MYHRVEVDSPLHKFLLDCLAAYKDRTEQWSNISVLHAIDQLDRKVDIFMASQEERLQTILVAVKNVKSMLADLKVNNPDIEDEIKAIEDELAPAPEPEPTPEPTPGSTPEGEGGVTP